MSDITHIDRWIISGHYVCPCCQFRMAGGAFRLAKAEHTCPRCKKRHIREFRREHK